MSAEDIANLVLLVVSAGFGVVTVRAHRAGRADGENGRRGTSTWGIGRRGAVRAYLSGWALGAAAIAVLAGLLVVLDVATVSGSGGASHQLAGWFAVVVYLAALNLVEEIVFRAFLLRGVIVALGGCRGAVAAAVLVTGVMTALPYLLGPATTPLSMLSAVLGGVTYCVAYLRSGGVWLSAGLRAGWNVVLGPVLGFTVSAATFSPTWFRATLDGPPAVAGGAYGPEAGLAAVLVRIALIAVLLATPVALLATRSRNRNDEPGGALRV